MFDDIISGEVGHRRALATAHTFDSGLVIPPVSHRWRDSRPVEPPFPGAVTVPNMVVLSPQTTPAFIGKYKPFNPESVSQCLECFKSNYFDRGQIGQI